MDVMEKVGVGASKILIERLKDWPTSREDAESYYTMIKQSVIVDLNDIESILNRSLKLLLKKREMDIHDTIAGLRSRITQLRDQITQSGPNTLLNTISEDKIFRALSMIFLTIQYESFIMANEANQMYDELEKFSNSGDYKSHYYDLRNAVTEMERTMQLYSKAVSDPASAEKVFTELRQVRKDFVELIEQVSTESIGSVNQLMTGVVIDKPRLFGKDQYIQSLADLIWNYAQLINESKVELPKLEANIKSDHPNAEFDATDLEQAINHLIDHNRAFSLGLDGNIKFVEFNQSDQSRVCHACGISGGKFIEFRRCENENQLVCDNCISFFGKCKLCGQSYKQNHVLLT